MSVKGRKGNSNHSHEGLRNFITYFQSVTTIGVINLAKSKKEAEAEAKKRMGKSDFTCGIVGQTPMTMSMTEEWPEKA